MRGPGVGNLRRHRLASFGLDDSGITPGQGTKERRTLGAWLGKNQNTRHDGRVHDEVRERVIHGVPPGVVDGVTAGVDC